MRLRIAMVLRSIYNSTYRTAESCSRKCTYVIINNRMANTDNTLTHYDYRLQSVLMSDLQLRAVINNACVVGGVAGSNQLTISPHPSHAISWLSVAGRDSGSATPLGTGGIVQVSSSPPQL